VFHLAGGGPAGTWADVAECALTAAGCAARVERVTTQQYYASAQGAVAPRPSNSELNCAKAAELGVRLPPWRDSVAAYACSRAF
ncbi:MAG: sugar nucleotide-binding protein, partial [Actinomycetota bacterium]